MTPMSVRKTQSWSLYSMFLLRCVFPGSNFHLLKYLEPSDFFSLAHCLNWGLLFVREWIARGSQTENQMQKKKTASPLFVQAQQNWQTLVWKKRKENFCLLQTIGVPLLLAVLGPLFDARANRLGQNFHFNYFSLEISSPHSVSVNIDSTWKMVQIWFPSKLHFRFFFCPHL